MSTSVQNNSGDVSQFRRTIDNLVVETETPTIVESPNKAKTKTVWKNVVILTFIHIGFLYYVFQFPYLEHKFLVIYTFIANHLTMLGITAGVHRLWTHRAYKAKMPLRIFLAACYYSSIEQFSITSWVKNHRVHHRYTDTDADPHNSKRGLWFSHLGWVLTKKNDEVRRREKEVDMDDINNDPVVQFFDRNFMIIKPIMNLVVPVLIPVYFFNQDLKWTFVSQIFLRYPCELHMAASVNSFAHLFGYHSYDKSIRPAQNRIVAFLTHGEGWHNYHHVFPWDYKAAEFNGLIFNTATSWIDMFAKIGWAYDLKQASPTVIQNTVNKKGDGTHYTACGSSKSN